MQETAYLDILDGTAENRMRVAFTTDHGNVISFVLQYETIIANRVYPVGRYDTAHGFAHRDLLAIDGSKIRRDPLPGDWTFNRAMQEARDDLKLNWRGYLEQFVGGQPWRQSRKPT